jgi:pilus assembly protein CpaE
MAAAPSVFAIDQDPEVRFQVQNLVRQAGFEAAGQSAPGTEAVASAIEAQPDAIVCGLREPFSRALLTVESLTRALPEAPLVAYAATSDLALVRKAMLAGARDFIRAPFSADELRASLDEALESEERRRLGEGGGAIGPQGLIITVYGAKGGVGKTSVATNLAVAIAKQGQATVLVDADDTFGDAAESLALAQSPSIIDALRSVEGESVKPYLTEHGSGLSVLAAPVNPLDWRSVALDKVPALLGLLARQFDVVVIDTGSTLSDVTIAALQQAAQVLWVTTPEYASVHDSLQAMTAFRGLGLRDDRVRLVLNAATPDSDVQASSIEQALAQPVFWTVPYDRKLRRTAQVGEPIVEAQPASPAAVSLRSLAELLMGAIAIPAAKKPPFKLFGRRTAARNGHDAGRPRLLTANDVAL